MSIQKENEVIVRFTVIFFLSKKEHFLKIQGFSDKYKTELFLKGAYFLNIPLEKVDPHIISLLTTLLLQEHIFLLLTINMNIFNLFFSDNKCGRYLKIFNCKRCIS